MHLDQHVSLKPLHTFGMEVKARYFVEARSEHDIMTLMNYRQMVRMPILFLGGGSNLLFTRDFNGLVVKISNKGIEAVHDGKGRVLVTAQAGERWDDFVDHCTRQGWAGLENLSLIPGTVGAAPIQNIGAYGVEVRDVIENIKTVDINTGRQQVLAAGDCIFGYRHSIFQEELKGKAIIMAVTFRLKEVDTDCTEGRNETGTGNHTNEPALLRLDYGGIRDELAAMSVVNPGIADVREAVIRIRSRKLPDPQVVGNAGSFFRNPVVGKDQYERISGLYPSIPQYPVPDEDPAGASGRVKIPAGWLIEQCGWKGYREGDAGVHPNQALVLVNYGNATGVEILELAQKIIESVDERFGIRLTHEVNII